MCGYCVCLHNRDNSLCEISNKRRIGNIFITLAIVTNLKVPKVRSLRIKTYIGAFCLPFACNYNAFFVSENQRIVILALSIFFREVRRGIFGVIRSTIIL